MNQIRRQSKKASKQEAVAFAAREGTHGNVCTAGWKKEIAQISDDVLAFTADFYPIRTRRDCFGYGFCKIKLFTKLIKVCKFDVCAEFDRAGIGLNFS